MVLIEGEQSGADTEKQQSRKNAHQPVRPDGSSSLLLGGCGHVTLHHSLISRVGSNVLANPAHHDDPEGYLHA